MPAPCRARPHHVASFGCFLKMIAGPFKSTLSRSSPLSLLVWPARKQAPQIIWLHRQAAGSSHSSSFASDPLPFHLHLA